MKIKTLNLGTFRKKWCQLSQQMQEKGTKLEGLLKVNLALKIVAKLPFWSNLEFTRTDGAQTIQPSFKLSQSPQHLHENLMFL